MTGVVRPLLIAAAAILLAASCRDSGANGNGGRTTVPTASSSTSTTAVSYDVPATIDAPYIEKVMAALDHVYGEAARYIAKHRVIDEQFSRYLVSLFGGESLELKKQIWATVASQEFQLLRPEPGDAKTVVERVIVAEQTCVLFQAARDFFAIFKEPDPAGGHRFVALVPLPPNRNTSSFNPTPWIMTFDGRLSDDSEPRREEACTAP